MLCALDTSGSMACGIANVPGLTSFDVCVSLGLYFSALNKGAFHNTVAMFDNHSSLKTLHGESFTDKWYEILKENTAWGGTNFQSLIDLIVDTRKKNPNIPLEDFPQTLIVVSDMQFNPTGSYSYSRSAERTNNESVIKSNVKEIETSKKEALKVIDKTVGTTLSKSEMPEIEKQVGRHIKVEEKKLAKLENFKNLFAEAEKKVKVSGGESTVIEELCKVLGIFEKSKISTTVKSVENYFADSLKPEEVEDFFRLVKSGTGAEAIDKAIKDSKDKIQTLENSLNSVKSAEAQIVKLGGEGAYIKKGVLYGADNKKVEFKPQQVKLANNVEVPETKKMRGLRHQIEKIEAEINKSTGEKLTAQEIEAKLANETKAVADAKSAVEKAREGLEKGVAKTPEQLKEEFTKLNGSKREAITKALNESKEELKPLFEKKWGSGKVAAAITGGAVVAGLLGYLIAPKRNS